MYPRTEYEMTEKQKDTLLEACKPTAVMMIGGYTSSSPQENANRAWKALGDEMGFDHMTVKPITDKGMRFFSAIPSENETQRKERLEREEIEKKTARIKSLEADIKDLQSNLNELLKD